MANEQDSSKTATPVTGKGPAGKTSATDGPQTNANTGLGSRPGVGPKPLDDDQPPQMKR